MGINGGAAKFLLTLATVFRRAFWATWGVAALKTSRYGLSSGIARWDHIFPRKIFRYLGSVPRPTFPRRPLGPIGVGEPEPQVTSAFLESPNNYTLY